MHRAAIYLDLPGPGDLLVVAIEDVGGVPGGLLVDRVTDLRRIGVQPGMTFAPRPDAETGASVGRRAPAGLGQRAWWRARDTATG